MAKTKAEIKTEKKNRLREGEIPVLEPEVVPADPPADVQELSSMSQEESEAKADPDSLPVETVEGDDEVSLETAPELVPTRAVAADIVPYDPLQAYLREIQAYAPLSREEERELAVRYRTNRDLEAAYQLVTRNLWLVVKIARDYERAARGLLDLIQEGNMGLMEAVKNFDPYRGVRFPSYAVWWIKAYIVRYLIANWRLVKIGTTQAQRKLFFNLKKEKEKLEREGFAPAPKLLAEKLNVKESEVIEMEQRLGSSELSVDAPLQADGETNLLGIIPAPEASQEDLLDRKKMQALIEESFAEFASTLNSKELIVFKERMLGEDRATLQDVAEELSLSRERIRQIENSIKTKLRAFLEHKYGPAIQRVLREALDF